MILINGYPTDTLLISDRGFQYGDGCFTTALVSFGVVEAWSYHLTRLKDNVAALSIEGVDWPALTRWAEKAAKQCDLDPKCVLKIIITRGVGGRGYSPSSCSTPNVVISTHPYPSHYETWQRTGINMIVLERRLGLSSLGGIKHLNRLEQVLFRKEIEAANVDDGVACDFNGKIVEASSSNLFWRKGEQLFTPTIDTAGVAGIMRARVIEAVNDDYDLTFVSALADTLQDADEIFITNAILNIVPVRRLGTKQLTHFDACKALRSRLR